MEGKGCTSGTQTFKNASRNLGFVEHCSKNASQKLGSKARTFKNASQDQHLVKEKTLISASHMEPYGALSNSLKAH